MIPDSRVVSVVQEQGIIGSNELAEELDLSRRQALERLKRLQDDGRLEGRKIGGIWMFTGT